MKKLSTIIVLFFTVYFVYGQTNRIILLENFIQASCNPCAFYNQETQNFLDTTTLSIVMINYHTPFPGEDTMHLQNPGVVEERMDYYNVNEAPISVIDGNYFQGGPIGSYFNGEYGWTIADMQSRAQVEGLIGLVVEHEFNENQQTIDITMDIEIFASINGSLRFTMVIVEKKIEFNEPPGTNGETLFKYVVKDVISGETEFPFSNDLQAGDHNTFVYNWEISNVFENEMISVVAFIQDDDTKEILQAGISYAKAIYENDVEIVSVLEPNKSYCNDPVFTSVLPTIKIRNRGSEPIDSVIVYCQINNEPIDTNNISLNLSFFNSKELFLNARAYTGSTPDTISFKLELPNIAHEEDTLNNFATVIFDTIKDAISPILYFYLEPDNYGSETTWKLNDEEGTVIDSGGPYENYNTNLIIDTFNILKKGCYYFTIYDSYGDGLQSGQEEGSYYITNVDGEVIYSGGDFRTSETKSFRFYKFPPPPIFVPENNSSNVSISERVLIGFNETIRFLDNTNITDPDSTFELRKNNSEGELIAVNFQLYQNKTIYFDNDLEYGTSYYLGFTEGMEDIYDNPIPSTGITFRTESEFVYVDENNLEDEYQIFPNPVKNKIEIVFAGEEKVNEIVITNQSGQEIRKLIPKNGSLKRHKIDIRNLKNGIYFITIITRQHTKTKKLVKI